MVPLPIHHTTLFQSKVSSRLEILGPVIRSKMAIRISRKLAVFEAVSINRRMGGRTPMFPEVAPISRRVQTMRA